MGALFSCCCGTEDDEAGEYGERTRLISECNTQTQVGEVMWVQGAFIETLLLDSPGSLR